MNHYKLITLDEGFRQYELALQNKDHSQIKIWQYNFQLLVDFITIDAYRKIGLNYNKIYVYVKTYIETYNALKYIPEIFIQDRILKKWKELECAELMLDI